MPSIEGVFIIMYRQWSEHLPWLVNIFDVLTSHYEHGGRHGWWLQVLPKRFLRESIGQVFSVRAQWQGRALLSHVATLSQWTMSIQKQSQKDSQGGRKGGRVISHEKYSSEKGELSRTSQMGHRQYSEWFIDDSSLSRLGF
jgi:hypothetical protein